MTRHAHQDDPFASSQRVADRGSAGPADDLPARRNRWAHCVVVGETGQDERSGRERADGHRRSTTGHARASSPGPREEFVIRMQNTDGTSAAERLAVLRESLAPAAAKGREAARAYACLLYTSRCV